MKLQLSRSEVFWILVLFIPLLLLPKRPRAWLTNKLPRSFGYRMAGKYVSAQTEEDPAAFWTQCEVWLNEAGYEVKGGRKYANSEAELEAYLAKVPEFRPYRPYLLRWLERARAAAGLTV